MRLPRVLLVAAILPASLALAQPAPPVPSSDGKAAALARLAELKIRFEAQSLHSAAMEAKAELVATLLDAGLDPNGPGMTGPALHSALMCDFQAGSAAQRLATVETLLAHGADPAWQDGNHNNLLMAAGSCPPAIVERLIAAGARVDQENVLGFGPLENALIRGKWAVAEVLIAKGARVTQAEVDKIFFELPNDSEKRAILARATGPCDAPAKH